MGIRYEALYKKLVSGEGADCIPVNRCTGAGTLICCPCSFGGLEPEPGPQFPSFFSSLTLTIQTHYKSTPRAPHQSHSLFPFYQDAY